MGVYYGFIIDANPTTQGSWDSVSSAWDGNIATQAICYDISGSENLNYNYGKTTNINEQSGQDPTQVKVRIKCKYDAGCAVYTQNLGERLVLFTYNGNYDFSGWQTLSTPSGGWTWDKIANLESKVFPNNSLSGVWVYGVELEVTTEESPTKTSVGSANARITVVTESEGSLNSRINIITESVGSLNARIFIAGTNETSVDVILTTSFNQDIELETSTNQNPILTTSTNKEIILN